MTERQHSVVAAILVIMGLYIMRIAAVEIQPFGEGEIAMRAEAIVQSRQWMDPSEHTVGGLSSTATPPLASWMSAAGIMLLGPTEIGVRLFSLLSMAGILALTYLIALKAMAHRNAMIAMSIVGLSMPMITLGRQMTPVVITTFMLLLSWWSTLKIRSSADRRSQYIGAALYGLALAGALLSSTLLALVALGLLIPVIIRRATLLPGVIGLVLGLALSIPWYAVMISGHGTDFILARSVADLAMQGVSGGSGRGPLDVLMMLVLASPLLVSSLVWVMVSLRYREMLPTGGDVVMMSAGLWFIVITMFSALGSQPVAVALVPIIPAAAIVSLAALQGAMQRSSAGVLLVHLGCIALASLAALLHSLRPLGGPSVLTSLLILVSIAVIVLVFFFASRQRQRLAVLATRPTIYGAVAVTAVLAAMTILLGNPGTVVGGRKVSLRLLEDTTYARRFVYLHHGIVTGPSVNSQLAWYTRGWMSHRKPRFEFTPLSMPTGVIDPSVVRAGIGAPWIVYFHPGIAKDISSEIFELLDNDYTVAEDTKDYVLFERRLRIRDM
ncbi:MAG: hypothetical protein FGM33_01770 [Candidatus Kapabacteria bacterium]|nr:hypothetical protein [Candidatus Kapabacteria bacterium]